jgi:uncharacterized protein DUF4145
MVVSQMTRCCKILENLAPCYVWAYNGAMKIANFAPQFEEIGASGECPHCSPHFSYFRPVATYLELPVRKTENSPVCTQKVVSACQCEACKGFVLVVGKREIPNPAAFGPFMLVALYPLGTPNQEVEEGVPPTIAADFQEALRCQWIKAFKACVVMCARAVQGSALALGAKTKKLTDQIDELFGQGKITAALKNFAHEVRVTRNLGAHPDKDGLEEVTKEDAGDIVEFTREYLHHIYVMPAKLQARKSQIPATTPSAVP